MKRILVGLLLFISSAAHAQDDKAIIFDWFAGKADSIIISTPVINGVPTISGTPTVGNTLTAHASSVTGGQIVTTWQWERDGVEIEGATSDTYLLTSDDYGVDITVVQTATNPEGSDTA